AAEGLTKRSAVGFLLRSLIMFQTFISRHNSNFFSDKLVLTSVTPASSAPVLQTPKATSSTLYFDSLTVNAGNGGFLHCIQMDTSVKRTSEAALWPSTYISPLSNSTPCIRKDRISSKSLMRLSICL